MKKLWLNIIFLIAAADGYAQLQRDMVLYTGLTVEKKISRSFTASFFNQYILNQNLNELGRVYSDVGITFNLNYRFSGELHYRYIKSRNLENFYDDLQRPYMDLIYSKRIKKFNINFRTRFQETFYGRHFYETYHQTLAYNNNEITISWRRNYYLQPYVSLETFYPLNNPQRKVIDQWRETIGLYYIFNRIYKVEGYYQIQNLTNRIHKMVNYVVGVAGYYRF
jgi:Protein of unknown function (DUF2490)